MKEEMSVYLYALGYLRRADARGFCVVYEKETACLSRAMSRTQEGRTQKDRRIFLKIYG
ncbi:MAG: hypothetical protein IJN16_00335 [Lachnospiraceae bacterium]|nr:hypothetical protein [Lachnospiraceae bacterium]